MYRRIRKWVLPWFAKRLVAVDGQEHVRDSTHAELATVGNDSRVRWSRGGEGSHTPWLAWPVHLLCE
jgi:hypothetical protein